MATKRIIDAVIAKKAALRDRAVAGQIRAMSVAALRGGIKSLEWRAYMMQFVEQDIPGIPVDQRQLDRLLGTDGTLGDPDMDLKRAYMVAAGPCGPETRERFGDFVNSIDLGLAPGCAPAAKPGRTRKKTSKRPRSRYAAKK
jgi:hypothetical protein